MEIISKMFFRESESPQIVSLQGLRGLAIFGVFLFHAGYGPFGPLGVSIFIVLSGFVMTYTYLDRELPATIFQSIKFTLIKVKKLFFANLFALVIYLPLIVQGMANDSIKTNLLKVMLEICMLKSFVPNETYLEFGNCPNWYLSVCLVTYFLFPFILKWLKKVRHLNLLAAALLLVDILFAIFLKAFDFSSSFCWWATYICPLSRIPEFVIGCIMGKMYKDKNCENARTNFFGGKGYFSILELLTIAIGIVGMFNYVADNTFFSSDAFRFTAAFLPCSIATVFLAASDRGIFSKILTFKPLVWLGNIGLYVFLFQLPILGYSSIIGNHHISTAVAFAVTVLLAILYQWYEKLARSSTSCKK